MVHHMGNFFAKWKMPWPHVAEDAFEASFKTYKLFNALIGRSSDLLGLRVFCAKRRVLADILKKRSGSRGGGSVPSANFYYIERADICVHPSIFKWECNDLSVPDRTIPVAAVAFRAFLRRLNSRTDGQADHVDFAADGSIIFRVGRPRRPGAPIPMITLCFPVNPPDDGDDGHVQDDVDAQRTIFCGCAKGDCSKDSCKCKKNNLLCTAKCHGKSGHNRCVQFVDVPPPQPRHPPGLTALCTCEMSTATNRAAANLSAWCARKHASFLLLANDPSYWDCVSQLVPSTQLDLGERLRKSLQRWREARAAVAQYKKAPKALLRRELFFLKWATKCCFEASLGKRIRADPAIVRYHMMGVYMKGTKDSLSRAAAKERARAEQQDRELEFERDQREQERNFADAHEQANIAD
jgi:hypothetical protein